MSQKFFLALKNLEPNSLSSSLVQSEKWKHKNKTHGCYANVYIVDLEYLITGRY